MRNGTVNYDGVVNDEDLRQECREVRGLAAHLQRAREEERKNIAREIHDELGQALTALKMDLSWLSDKYSDHKLLFDKTACMLQAINSTIKTVRHICTELRPSVLDDFGLADAMQWQADDFQKRTGIACMVNIRAEETEIDKDLCTAIFRIFQEALVNVYKHARATKTIAKLIHNHKGIILEIMDDGIGIEDKELSKLQSYGLMGMRERVRPWGGRVLITGKKNEGTVVRIIMPANQP